MDLRAIEILEEALQLYQGILIAVSHDQAFIKKICNRRLHLQKNRDEGGSNAILEL